MMPGTGEVTYVVLADRAVPYLLARVRWPDVAQAISARAPDWLDDPGLFDLPYDPSAVALSFSQAVAVAASWGRQLHPEAAEGVSSYIRRMPANWSDLSPSERRAWGFEHVGTRRTSARRAGRAHWFKAKIPASSAVAQAKGQVGTLASAGGSPGTGVDGPAANGHSQVTDATSSARSAATERRRHARVRVDGRAHIRSGHITMSAGLVDLSEGGVRCVLPGASPLVGPDAALGGPFLIEAEVATSTICLDVAGRISWYRGSEAGSQFGVVFGELADGETEGARQFLTAVRRRRGYR